MLVYARRRTFPRERRKNAAGTVWGESVSRVLWKNGCEELGVLFDDERENLKECHAHHLPDCAHGRGRSSHEPVEAAPRAGIRALPGANTNCREHATSSHVARSHQVYPSCPVWPIKMARGAATGRPGTTATGPADPDQSCSRCSAGTARSSGLSRTLPDTARVFPTAALPAASNRVSHRR